MAAHGSAVLVHGAWGHPEDWRWVREDLERAGVQVTAPDLPSHWSAAAGLDHDADIVRQAIRAASEPVVAAGWSYGGAVLSVAAASGDARVAHLVYVAAVPALPDGSPADLSWLDADPHVHAGDGTHVLDNDWWLHEEAGATFPAEVRTHLARYPRRPMSLLSESAAKVTAPPPWEAIPTTVLLGTHDDLVSAEQRAQARQCTADVRVLDVDHFLIFRRPASVSRVVLEALQRG